MLTSLCLVFFIEYTFENTDTFLELSCQWKIPPKTITTVHHPPEIRSDPLSE